MSCERHRPALIEAALGIAPPPELARHLDECTRCSAQLDRQRSLLARIDGEIQAGMEVAASAEFLARVRQRAAQRKSGPWPVTGWLLPFAAAVGVLALSGLALRRGTVEPQPAAKPAVAEERRPLPEPRQEPEATPPLAAPERAASATPRPPARGSEPEVFLRPGDQALVRRFAETIRHRPVRAAVLLEAGFDPGGAQEVPVAAASDPAAGTMDKPLAPMVIGPLRAERADIKPLTIEASDARPVEPDDVKPSATEMKKRSES